MLTKIPKFRRCVIQNFPFIEEDFDALTDYELLCKVVEYLNKVIESQNEVVESTEGLLEAFSALQSYVANYFENLDVQEEINNKLDAMVEAGTLQEIITTYIQSNVAWTFDTVADMKLATNLVAGSYARTLGFRSLNDGGGALYHITNSGTANEMDVIAIGSLYATIVLPTILSPEMLGSVGDGVTDDTAVLQRTFALSKNIRFDKNYFTSGKIDILSGTVLDGGYRTVTNATAINLFRANTQDNITIKNLTLIGDNTLSEAQIGLNFISCNKVVVENVTISGTGGDGVSFSGCSNCELRNAKLSDNLISAFAYNSNKIIFKNIDVYKPRFRFGIQFKSCNNSVMSDIYVDTPKDVGVYINKGSEDGSNDTADIALNNITVLNQGQDGTITTTTRYSIVMANGTRMKLNNAYVNNGVNNGVLVVSDNSSITNSVISNNAWSGITCGSPNLDNTNIMIKGCTVNNNGNNGIEATKVSGLIINGCNIYDNGDSTSKANLKMDTCVNAIVTDNVMIVAESGDPKTNILTVTSCEGLRILGNSFINNNTSASYSDYRGVYDYAHSVFKNNGSCRFNGIGGLSVRCTAEWDNGGLVISDFRTSIPTYAGFNAGDKFLNKTGTGYVGWIYDGTDWHGYGAIVS